MRDRQPGALNNVLITVLNDVSDLELDSGLLRQHQHGLVAVGSLSEGEQIHIFQWKHGDLERIKLFEKTWESVYQPCVMLGIRLSQIMEYFCYTDISEMEYYPEIENYINGVFITQFWANRQNNWRKNE